MNVDIKLHKKDLPDEIEFSDKIAIDCEFTGLNIQRDRLCLVQLSNGKNDAHIVQLDKDNFYYFNYKKGLMKVFSSNDDFNKIVSETKKDETKKKVKDKLDYQFMLGAPKDVAPFVATFMK